jgi:LmbE family N-acetylglucosaminyl deacetylase/SAM-dependent methyltransferase
VVTFRHDDDGGAPAVDWVAPRRALAELDLDAEEWADLEAVVVVAAHPDDESLGAGGLLHEAARRGLDVRVVCATAGEASHPRSPTHTPDDLRRRRARELDAAVEAVAGVRPPLLLDLADGEVAAREADLVTALVDLVGDGRHTLLAAPWRHDAHPDHEAAGRAAAAAAVRTGARLVEYPVWFWHWAEPRTALPAGSRRLPLPDAARAAKARAVAAHRSQVEPLSPQPGDEVLLDAAMLAHFGGEDEVFVLADPDDRALDDVHREAPDPWGVERRWYEERKRALLLAVLPRARFAHGVEVGCSTGVLAQDLAARCAVLDAVDSSTTAVDSARQRLRDLPHVRVHLGAVGDVWSTVVAGPTGPPDLVVVSEVGYFLSPSALDRLAADVARDLADDGVVVLCHWRHQIDGWVLDGRAAHDRLEAGTRLAVLARYQDRDVEIVLLGRDGQLPDPHA